MRAYEFLAVVEDQSIHINLPPGLGEGLPSKQRVRVLVLVPEAADYDEDLTPEEEAAGWQLLTQAAFLALGEDDDAEVYDDLEMANAAVSGR